jgi:CPA1 family monovalent cation:H+ antiporter
MVAVLTVLRLLLVPPLLMFLRARANGAERQQSIFLKQLDRIRLMADRGKLFARRSERAERMYTRRENDIQQGKAEGFGWRGALILSWSGMRGVVTLAAAQSLPEDFHYRAQLVLIAFTVAVVTLLMQGGTLPLLIRLTGIQGTDREADRRQLASLLDEIIGIGIEVLDNPRLTLPAGEKIDPALIERVRRDTLLTAESAWERAEHGAGIEGLTNSPQRQYRELRREVLQAEHEALLEARAGGSYASRILSRAQTMLDLEETRLAQIDDPSGY